MTDISSKELSCFIIMPFSLTKVKRKKLSQEQLSYIYKHFFHKAVKSYQHEKYHFSEVTRYEGTRGNFVKGIIGKLQNADLVIADLTGLNPNVFYELGIRHTLKNGTILLTQDISSLPSDLKSYIAFEYKYPDAGEIEEYYPKFEKKLHTVIDEFVLDMNRADNPVKDFLGIKNIIKDEQRKKDILANIGLIKFIQSSYAITVQNIHERLNDWVKNEKAHLLQISIGVEPVLNKMVSLNESHELISFLNNLLQSQDIISFNQKAVLNDIKNTKTFEKAREIPLPFFDRTGNRHHVSDLFKFHISQDATKRDDDPVYASFNYFVSTWENELREIDK